MKQSTYDMYTCWSVTNCPLLFIRCCSCPRWVLICWCCLCSYHWMTTPRQIPIDSTRKWKIRIRRKVDAIHYILLLWFCFSTEGTQTKQLHLNREGRRIFICWWQLQASLTELSLFRLASDETILLPDVHAYHVVLYLMSRIYEANEMANKSPTWKTEPAMGFCIWNNFCSQCLSPSSVSASAAPRKEPGMSSACCPGPHKTQCIMMLLQA